MPGRKNPVWVSSSFPLTLGQERFDVNWDNDTGENFQHDTARAARVLTDANVAVYPVDARGILGSAENAAGDYADPPPPEFAGYFALPEAPLSAPKTDHQLIAQLAPVSSSRPELDCRSARRLSRTRP